MKTNLSNLKAKLSENIEKVKNGETVTIYDRNTPVAKIIPYDIRQQKLLSRKPLAKLNDMKLKIKIDFDPAEVIFEGRRDR